MFAGSCFPRVSHHQLLGVDDLSGSVPIFLPYTMNTLQLLCVICFILVLTMGGTLHSAVGLLKVIYYVYRPLVLFWWFTVYDKYGWYLGTSVPTLVL